MIAVLGASAQTLEKLAAIESDSLLSLIAAANADQRPEKIDVGVGVYRDGAGRTPILRAIKAAEKRLWDTQDTKAYLGGAGSFFDEAGTLSDGIKPFLQKFIDAYAKWVAKQL